MAIERKSELRTVEILFNEGSLVSIQSTFFERLEEDGAVVPGTFSNRVALFDPESAEGKQVVYLIGEAAIAGIEEKDKALNEAYATITTLRGQLKPLEDTQLQLITAQSEVARLREQIKALAATSQS